MGTQLNLRYIYHVPMAGAYPRSNSRPTEAMRVDDRADRKSEYPLLPFEGLERSHAENVTSLNTKVTKSEREIS